MEVEEVVAALDTPSGEERQRLDRMGLHGVLPIFMGVDVLSKIKEAIIGELNGLDGNHVSRVKRRRDAILNREAVDPERYGINNLVHKYTWDAAI